MASPCTQITAMQGPYGPKDLHDYCRMIPFTEMVLRWHHRPSTDGGAACQVDFCAFREAVGLYHGPFHVRQSWSHVAGEPECVPASSAGG